jgi:hypothetical protein
MNERIKELANKAVGKRSCYMIEAEYIKFAKLIVEEVLDQVKERAYYTGDRDWSDEVDRPWIQLEFGYGPLEDAKKGIFK